MISVGIHTKEKTRQVLVAAAGIQIRFYFISYYTVIVSSADTGLGQRHYPLRQTGVPGYMLMVPPADGFSPSQ